jgi:hypothetical protein
MGCNARAKVEAHFTLAQMVSRHEEFFQRLVADRRVRVPAATAPDELRPMVTAHTQEV